MLKITPEMREEFWKYVVRSVSRGVKLSNGAGRGSPNLIVEVFPITLFSFLSEALRKLCPKPYWIYRGMSAHFFDNDTSFFPAGKFADANFLVIVSIRVDRYTPTVTLTIESPFPEQVKAFRDRLYQEFNGVFEGGFFEIDSSMARRVPVDDLPDWESLKLERSKKEIIEREVFRHFEMVSVLKEHGYSTTLGVLFYGRPGTGKTHTIKAMVKKFVKMGVPVFNLTGCNPREFISTVRFFKFLPQGVFILEDLETMGSSLYRDYHSSVQSALLSILDGLNEIENRIFLFTTNFYDSLDEALLRPGRIDIRLEFTATPDEVKESLVPVLDGRNEELKCAVFKAIDEYRLTYAQAHTLVKFLLKKRIQGIEFSADEEITRFVRDIGAAGGRNNTRLGFSR